MTRKSLLDPSLMVIPTPAERRNGWNVESLGEYLDSRRRAMVPLANGSFMPVRAVHLPRESNHRYNPKRWRK